MVPYFYNLQERIISDSVAAELVSFYEKEKNNFVAFAGYAKGILGGNHFFYGPSLSNLPSISEIVNSCNLMCVPVLLFQLPNTAVVRHIDEMYDLQGRKRYRTTLLITPLIPVDNYAPTNFYEKDVKVASCYWENHNSHLFNAQVMHDLETSNSVRLNFQLGFAEPFETVLELSIQNKLFKNNSELAERLKAASC